MCDLHIRPIRTHIQIITGTPSPRSVIGVTLRHPSNNPSSSFHTFHPPRPTMLERSIASFLAILAEFDPNPIASKCLYLSRFALTELVGSAS